MELKYKLQIEDAVWDDLSRMDAYVRHALFNPSAADKLYVLIKSEMNDLVSMPKKFQVWITLGEPLVEIRRRLVGNYSILYQVDDANGYVRVHGVFYSRRDMHELMRGRV